MNNKKLVFTVAFVFVALAGIAQSKIQRVERIGDTLYLVEKGERFKVDTNVITVKLKSSENALGKEFQVINSNRLGFADIQVPKGIDVESYVNELKQTERFEIVEYNGEAKCCLTPNDTCSFKQSYISKINLADAWNITTGSQNVKVAIIDTGVDASHLDLGYGNDDYSHIDTVNGVNYTSEINTHIDPVYDHGTNVAGVLGAKTNNTTGIAGVSGGNHSKGITIIPYCVGNSLYFTTNSIDDAILDAVDKGVKVINISLSTPSSTSIESAIDDAYANNVTIVCATGNGYRDSIAYPASNEKTIAVGALGNNNERAFFSNYDTGLDLVAPGEGIYSTTFYNQYAYNSGTSLSTPQVAGVVALMLSVNPNLTPSQIKTIITGTCTKLTGYSYSSGWNNEVGYGLLNAFMAVNLSASHSIVGPSVITGSGTYYITNLPDCVSVEWSLSDSYFNQNCLQQNTPLPNRCTITSSTTQDMNNATLTATIKYNGATIQTLTKTGISQGFIGTYSSSTGSGQYIAPNPIYTAANTNVQVCSPKLNGATFNFTGDATPSYFQHYNNTINVKMPSTGSTIVVNVHCANGTEYYIPIIKTYNPYYMSVSQNGESMTVTLDESATDDQAWRLEIYNTTTGKKIATQNILGRSITFNTSGWKRGLYAVRAIVDKEVLTEKIQIR